MFFVSFIQLFSNSLLLDQKLIIVKLFCMRVKFGVSHYIEEHTLWLYWYQCSEYNMWKNRVSKTKLETQYIGHFIHIALKQTNVNRIIWKHKENSNTKLEHVAAAKCTYWRTLQQCDLPWSLNTRCSSTRDQILQICSLYSTISMCLWQHIQSVCWGCSCADLAGNKKWWSMHGTCNKAKHNSLYVFDNWSNHLSHKKCSTVRVSNCLREGLCQSG